MILGNTYDQNEFDIEKYQEINDKRLDFLENFGKDERGNPKEEISYFKKNDFEDNHWKY